MSERTSLGTAKLSDFADVNPENLGAATRPDFAFRYVDLSSVSGGRIQHGPTSACSFGSAPSRARRRLRPGDVLFGTVRPAQRSHALFDGDGTTVASTGFAVLRARPGDGVSSFLRHFVLSDDAARQAHRSEVGSGYPAVNEVDVSALALPQFGVEEQRRIAEVLDTVDEAIRAVERIVTMLGSVRHGLLLALMRPEASWRRGTLGDRLLRIESGKSPPTTDRRPAAGEWGVLKVSSVAGGGFRPEEAKAIVPAQRRPQDVVRLGDLLMTRANTAQFVGLACRVDRLPGPLQLSDKTLRLVPRPDVVPQFLLHALQTPWCRRVVQALGTGTSAGMKNISQAEIRSISLAFPDRAEQQRTVEVLDGADARIHAEEAGVRSLHDLRAGLADDLLTGRVRTVPG
ncbi:hypothetical protein [Iamia sp.]|uniref:hypothetical protein n=1 Tax=Iamia sp. TaxID=2722710 RepID=UPI002D19C8D3|nr:hypothetical protein [Iamia sp.]HXH57902.1 hypothetical protein [Iamia sp.]